MNLFKKLLDKGRSSYGTPVLTLWLVVLPLFCAIQLHWLNQVRDLKQENLTQAMSKLSNSFHRDFSEVLESVSNHFSLQAINQQQTLEQLRQEWARFSTTSPYKNLVSNIYVIDLQKEELVPYEFLTWSEELNPISWPGSLGDLASFWARRHTPFDAGATLVPKDRVLIIPNIKDHGEVAKQWIVLVLNESYLVETLVPELVGKYFLRGAQPDYMVAAIDNTDNQRVFYRSNLDLSLESFEHADVRMAFFDGITPNKTTHKVLQTQISNPGWELLVRHRTGSLLAAANLERNENALIGLAMCLVIGIAFMLPFHAARQAQAMTARQLAFFSGLSHDLCAPLSVISSAAYNLTNSVVSNPDRVKLYGQIIKKESGRLHDMVNQVMEYSRAHSENDHYQLKEIEVETWVRSVMSDHENLLNNNKIESSVLVQEGLPALAGDMRALKSALANLITNAAKYGADRHWIGIRAYADGGQICVEVADRGAGIPLNEQKQLFDPYFRASAALASGTPGSGLGLNLVRKIMKKHGGSVTIRSNPGEGAAFTLSVPIPGTEFSTERGGLLAWKKRFSW